MSASESFARANELFVEESFDKAATHYDITLALANATSTPSTTLATYYLHRAHNHMKLKNYRAALNDAEQSLTHQPDNASAVFRKGTALFSLDQFSDAYTIFTKAESLGYKPSECKLWIRKTQAEMKRTGVSIPTTSSTTSSTSITSTPTSTAVPTPAPQTAPSSGTLADKVNTGWFQTSTHVTITIFAKGTKKDDIELKISDRLIDITIPMPDGSKFGKTWNLFGSVDTQYHLDHTPYKLELGFKKIVAENWDTLEAAQAPVAVQKRENIVTGKVESYPTSRPVKTNWTEVEKDAVKQEEAEKPEGEAALQKLFQSIYSGADEDTRRAMVKSYQTSGGTVLSTNWKEVADKNYENDRTAPKGQEFRDWNKM